jgi:hypothetical protein
MPIINNLVEQIHLLDYNRSHKLNTPICKFCGRNLMEVSYDQICDKRVADRANIERMREELSSAHTYIGNGLSITTNRRG